MLRELDTIFSHRIMLSACTICVLLTVVLLAGCSTNQPVILTGTIHVDAMLDNSPWAGPVNFTVTGQASGTSVPKTYTNIPGGNYSLNYLSGGPPDASFAGITPTSPQTVTAGDAIAFTLNFRTKEVARSDIVVKATLTKSESIVPWMGPVNFTLTGPETISGASVPHPYTGMPLGDYTLNYISGGPPGTTLFDIIPSTTQTLTAGDTITFTMEFR